MRKAATRLLDALDAGLGAAAVFCLVAIAATTLAGVISRYIFAASLTWTGEAGQWLFIYLIFLGVPLAHRSRLHIAIGGFEKLLPPRARKIHQVLIDAAVAYTTIVLMTGAQELLDLIGGKSTALALPAWLQYAGIPASCVAGLLYIALRDLDRDAGRYLGALGVALGAAFHLAADLIALPPIAPLTMLIVVFLGGMALGMPIAFAMLLSVFLADLSAGVLPPAAIAQNVVRGSGQFLLLAIPLFLLAGALMDVGGLAKRLIDFAHTLVRHMRAGLAQVTIVAATLYGGVSGSSNANAALNARLMYPAMVKDGYKPPFAAAVCAAASMTDNIIPPSVGMLIVGAATGISVGQMFVAGIVPGLLFAGALMLAVWAVARMRGYKANAPRASWAERGHAMAAAIPVILLAVFIVATLRLGIATPTETGAMAVAFAFIAGLWLKRGLSPAELWRSLRQTALDSAMIGLLIGAATPFGFVLTTEHVPQAIVEFGETWLVQKWVMLLFLNGVLLLAGMVMDIGAAMLIFAPLFLPLTTRFGVEPVHFALIVICNLMIGGLKPPFGILAFIVATITRLPVMAVFMALIPFLIALLAALLLVTYIPAITMGLLWLGL
ncbi:MAG: TRAP transporter large permease subunit [Alphaproteobacteria bacterium]|nr:TRAP transporter large permease subunit [Alphaproteobacteria bacterium]